MTATAALQSKQFAGPPGRTPERAELARRISELAAASADLDFTQQSMQAAQHKKFDAGRMLDKLKQEAAEAGDSDIAAKVIEAVKAGRDIDASTLNAAAENIAKEVKKATQEYELFKRAYTQLEYQLPAKQMKVEQAHYAVQVAAKAVIAASNAFVRLCNDLEILQQEIIKKRIVMRFFASAVPVPSDAGERIKKLMIVELPGHPNQPAYRDWTAYPEFVVWNNALQALMTNPDARLPDV